MAVHPSRALTRIGTAAVATGIGHDLLGAWLYRRQLAGIARDGLRGRGGERRPPGGRAAPARGGAVVPDVGRGDRDRGCCASWCTGDRRSGGAHRCGLTAMGVIGAAVLPRSGFWLLIGGAPPRCRWPPRSAVNRYQVLVRITISAANCAVDSRRYAGRAIPPVGSRRRRSADSPAPRPSPPAN